MSNQLDHLEDRLIDLEFRQLKKKLGWDRTLITAKKTPPTEVPLQMRVSTQPNGAKKCEIRTATGWNLLPADRALWPKWAREAQDRYDAYDKQHRINGRRVATMGGSVDPA